MPKLIIDLSGKGGLGSKFFGDSDQVTPTPNKRYQLDDNELASGTFNPFMRDGYISPTVDVLHAVTLDQTLNSVAGSSLYDPINDDYYFGERGAQIFKGDGLTDTSLARQRNLGNEGATVHDLEAYQINGTRKLFYVYKGRKDTAATRMSADLSVDTNWIAQGFRVNPVASTAPSLLYSDRLFESGSSTTQTNSITVPAGSNKCLVVVAFSYNATAPTGATWDGNAMTQITTGSGTFGAGSPAAWDYSLFRYVAPAAATGDVVVTWAGAHTNRLMHVYVFDNVHQTSPITSMSGDTGSTDSPTLSYTITANTQVPIFEVFSGTATHTQNAGQIEVFDNAESPGHDSSSYYNYSTADSTLRVGIATLPFASADDDWLNITTTGAFESVTTSNYNFMRTADNGYAYLFADNKVHKIDGTELGGTNGTVSENVLLFPSYFRVTDAHDYRGNMYMVIHQSQTDPTSVTQTNFTNPCGVYVWDRLTTQVRMRDYINVEGVRVIKKIYVAPNGALRIITISSDGITQIRQFTGSVFEVIKELGIGAAPQYSDSLTTAGNKTMWLAPDGSLYCHGQTNVGSKEALARIGQIRAPQAETTAGYSENITAGAILYGYGTDSAATGFRSDRQGLTLSYSTGTPLVKKFYPFDKSAVNSTNQTSHIGDIFTGVKILPFMSTVDDIDIFMLTGTATGSTVQATIKIYFNGSTTAWASKTVTRDDISKGYKNIKVGKPFVSSVQIEIEYATGVALSDTYDFHPFYAEVLYTPTSALTNL